MKLSTFSRRNLAALSASVGVGVVVTMGALTVAQSPDGVDPATATVRALPEATLRVAATELATPSAAPTFTATPCPKRKTMPCT